MSWKVGAGSCPFVNVCSDSSFGPFDLMDAEAVGGFIGRRKDLRERKNRIKRFRVRLSLECHGSRLLSAADVQNFVLYTLFGQAVCVCPDWVTVTQRKRLTEMTLLVMNYECADDAEYPSWSFLTSAKFDTLSSSVRSSSSFVESFRYVSSLPDGTAGRTPLESEKLGPVGRDALVLSWKDLMENGYPIPRCSSNTGSESALMFTNTVYGLLSNDSPIFAIDCEFCLTLGERQAVTRVSVVDECHNVILDTLVKPSLPIIDYVTKYSGITADMLRNVTTSLQDVQQALQEVIPCNAILVGHSLQFDLATLHMFHPYVMDTSLLYNLSGNKRTCASLKQLSKVFLNSSIQDSSDGHCSVEDAVSTMKLVQLKLRNGWQFGHVPSGWIPTEPPKESTEIPNGEPFPELHSDANPQEFRDSTDSFTNLRANRKVERCACNRQMLRPCCIRNCSCRALVWRQRCKACMWLRGPKEEPSLSTGLSQADICKIFEGHKKESVLRPFERFQKTMHLVTCEEERYAVEPWESSPSAVYRHLPTTEECLSTLRSDLFSHDLSMAIAKLEAKNVDFFNNFVEQLVKCLPGSAVLCLLILADKWSKQKSVNCYSTTTILKIKYFLHYLLLFELCSILVVMSFRGRGGGMFGRSRGGGRGFRGGGRGGYQDTGPPEHVTELGVFTHPCLEQIVCKCTTEKVPYFNAPVYFENKEQVGKVDEIFGGLRNHFVSITLADGIKASSFTAADKVFIDPYKLLPMERFLPGAAQARRSRGRGGGDFRGRGGRFGGDRGRWSGGRTQRGFSPGRGGGDRGGDRGGGRGYGRDFKSSNHEGGFGQRRGEMNRGRSGFFERGRGGFDRGRGAGYDRGDALRKDCTAVFVRWARVRISVTPAASGSHSLGTCMSLCSDGAYPSKPGVHMACAGFNYKYGSSAATSDCQFFEHGQMRNFDWYAEANDQYAFFRKYCVPTLNACKSTHQFDFYTDRYVDDSLVDRKLWVESLEDCLGLCLDEKKFTCRSATFNRTSNWCMLSTRSRQTHPKMVKVNNNPNYRIDYYENNCQNSSVQVSHNCQQAGISVVAESKFPYTGAMYGLYDFFTCRIEPKDELKFQMFFPFPSVGKNCSESIVLEGDEYILDVVVSLDGVKPLYFVTDQARTKVCQIHGSELTLSAYFVQDLIYQARCPRRASKLDSYPSATVGTALHMRPAKTTTEVAQSTEMPVTLGLSIVPETTTSVVLTETTTTSTPFIDNSTKDEPIAFDILHNGQSVKAVVIGNKITLHFTASTNALPAHLVLVACQIEPINSPYAWERDPLQIIRSGCQADGVGLVCPPEKTSSGVKVVMEAFRYTTTSEVLFSCMIRNCNYGLCPQPVCPSVEGCDPAQKASTWSSDIETKNVRIEPTDFGKGRFSFTDGDHVVSRKLIVVNSVHELQYFLKTGNVPSGVQSAGFFQG
ncbi:hypothetical protein M514_01841 [Trichuris suis]|uniref:Probable H/ACA ribonucleoprotein complex subunit 1-like protein n=1 Tax=Trichuris suis TaxID=68888 RepID=A0A085NTB9_9BILA|nr:hypothetical protein M514_01841 [Trichuris suis]